VGGTGGITNQGGVVVLGGTVDLSGGTLDVTATGIFATLKLDGTVRDGTSRPDGGTLVLGNAVYSPASNQTILTGPTLDGMIFEGVLNLAAATSSAAIRDGLTLLSASGGQPGSIDLTAGQLTLLDNETLTNVAITLGTSAAGAGITDNGAGRTLTLGSLASLAVTGSATIAVGSVLDAGMVTLTAAALTLATSGSAGISGTVTATGASSLNLAGQSFGNTGTLHAAGGTLTLGAGLSNFAVGTTLSGGTYLVDGGATIDLSRAASLSTDNADIVLNGAGAALLSYSSAKAAYQTVESTLRTIATAGTLAVLGGRGYAASAGLVVNGLLQLGGGTLSAAGVTLSASGRLMGNGVVGAAVINAGTIEAQGGLLKLAGMGGAGKLQIDATGTLEVTAATAQTVLFNATGGELVLDAVTGFTGTLSNFAPGDTLVLTATAATSATLSGSSLVVGLATGGSQTFTLSSVPSSSGTGLFIDGAGDSVVTLVPAVTQGGPCFRQGTRLLTARGAVAVEELRVGDLMATMLGGRLAPVRWIGHRLVRCARHPRPWDVWPVRIEPGAFGVGMPLRPLFLSPDHAVHVDGVLIPIRYLINGASVAQMPVADVTYWHVELADHDVLLAEGLPAESYLDTGNRGAFGGRAPMLHPDFARDVWAARGCAPLRLDGPSVVAARAGLLARAAALGFLATRDADPRLSVAGRIVRARETVALPGGRRFRFRLPAGAGSATLLSRTAAPAHLRPDSDDQRILGMAVTAAQVDGRAAVRTFGWHPAEAGWQWTDGAAGLGCDDAEWLELDVLDLQVYWHPRSRPVAGTTEAASRQHGVGSRDSDRTVMSREVITL
jgi:collagen type I/II/III/V/XI/XXIV/XXVII alpha